MVIMADIRFRYFSPEPGRAVARFGTGMHIGASRGPNGFDINPDTIVAIPETEIARYAKEYRQAVEQGDLRERTEEEYTRQQSDRERNDNEAFRSSQEAAQKEAQETTEKMGSRAPSEVSKSQSSLPEKTAEQREAPEQPQPAADEGDVK